MATKPDVFINWTSGLDPSQIVQPPPSKQAVGWLQGEAPAYEYMNWLFYILDQWTQYFAAVIGGNYVPNIRLLTSGTFSYVNSTGVLSWSAALNLSVPSLPDSYNQLAAGNVTLTDGEIAYIVPNLPFTTQGSITTSSNQITSLGSVQGITVGQLILGTGIPSNTTVSSISGTTVTMSANATSTASGENITFGSNTALSATVISNASYVPGPNDLVFARRAGSIIFVGVDENGMVIHDNETKPFLGVGYGASFQAPAGENLTNGEIVYISTSADGRTTGDLYRVDASASTGTYRHVFSGFVQSSVSSSATATVVTDGIISGLSGLVAGTIYYADPSNIGQITATKPSTVNQWVVPVGIAISTTQLITNAAALGSLSSQFGGSSGGGGGGGALIWVEGVNSPTPVQFNGSQIYNFDSQLEQILTTSVIVPQNYLPGSPINLYMLLFSLDTSGILTFNTIATLIRTGTDPNGSITNQHQSTNSSISLSGATSNINQSVNFDLTDSAGKINGVAVSPGDLIEIELIRGVDTSTLTASVFVDASQMSF